MDTLHTLLSIITSIAASAIIVVNAFIAPWVAEVSQNVAPTPVVRTETHVSTTQTTEPTPAESSDKEPSTTNTSSRADTSQEAAAINPTPQQKEDALPPPPLISSEELTDASQAALVNIFCTLHNGRKTQAVSGSGSFIDHRGVILTNAHVGQFFLLKDYPTTNDTKCVVRAGSPAREEYTAELLYLPPTWIEDNASQIVAKEGRGTGEHDYAFLLVTGTTDGTSLPSSFPALPLTLQEPKLNSIVLLTAYPAEDLRSSALERRLEIDSAYAGVTKLFTFDDNRKVDLFSIGGTEVSQSGSSGGVAVRIYDGRLEGIITTASEGNTATARDLRAITLAHIDRSLAVHGMGGLTTLLSGDLQTQAAQFNKDTAPGEKALLVNELENN